MNIKYQAALEATILQGLSADHEGEHYYNLYNGCLEIKGSTDLMNEVLEAWKAADLEHYVAWTKGNHGLFQTEPESYLKEALCLEQFQQKEGLHSDLQVDNIREVGYLELDAA